MQIVKPPKKQISHEGNAAKWKMKHSSVQLKYIPISDEIQPKLRTTIHTWHR